MTKGKEEKKKAAESKENITEEPLDKVEDEIIETEIKDKTEEKETCDVMTPEEKLIEVTDKYLRLTAEFDNFRKRTIKEKDNMFTDGKAYCATAFLPLMDNMERAITSAKTEVNPATVLEGMEKILKQLNDILSVLGIEEIPAKDEEFDPLCHDAVMHIEDEAIDTNTVIEELQKGYMMDGKILRHSMVKVAN